MNIIVKNFYALLLCLVFAQPVYSSSADTVWITGTYSTLRYIEEAGDLLGEELRIVYTYDGYQGMLQIAQGEPSHVMIFKVYVDGNKLSFDYKDLGTYWGHFEGEVTDAGISGAVTRKEIKKQLVLPRKSSYWDCAHPVK